jgi:hypothetical protein
MDKIFYDIIFYDVIIIFIAPATRKVCTTPEGIVKWE